MVNLKNARKAKALSMKALGKLVNLSESTISLYESGKRNPDNNTLKLLADVLDVSADYLLGRTDASEIERDANTILIARRDGKTFERKLTPKQLELLENLLSQMPDCDDEEL